MDKITYLEFLESLSRSALEDYLENIWKEKIDINEAQEKWLGEYLETLKREKVEDYVKIFILLLALLAALTAYQGPIRRISNKLTEVKREDYPWDLMWVTKPGACDKCQALNGKIYGRDFNVKPDLHPNCRCALVRVPKGSRAMNIGTLNGGAVRAIKDGKKRILEVLAAPFGSQERKDKLGQFLSANTDFMIGVGDKRPLLYFHGFTPRAKAMKMPFSIGTATATRVDDKGLWMRAELGEDELSDRTWNAALEGKARASTGSVNYLERHDNVTGEVYCWPIAELSVFDGGDDRVPVSDDAVVLPLRALYNEIGLELPVDFEAGEDKRAVVDERQTLEKDNEMEKKEFEALYAEKEAEKLAAKEAEDAMRAEIRKEVLEEVKPNYRSTFNINKVTQDKGLDAVELENFAFCRGLIEDGLRVAGGGMPRSAMRVTTPLEETEADEIQSMVPADMYNQIHVLLGKYSLVDKLANAGMMSIYNTDKLVFNVPTEVTAMTTMADIAEAAGYTENSPEFVNTAITMQKVGNFISVTEEALEDQSLFQSWLPKACAKAIALAKNLDLHTLCDATAGTAQATTDVITDAELIAMYYGLDQEYRDGAAMIMNDGTLAYIRAMALAASSQRAYGEFGFNPMSMGELGEKFFNKPVLTNSNWVSMKSGATNNEGITFCNFDEAIFWVERKKLSIFVDPYSTKLSAGTVNFLPSARYAGATVNAAAMNSLDWLT